MVITGEEVGIVLGVLGFLGGGAGVLIKLGKIQQSINDHGDDIKKYKDKSDKMVTLGMCESRQGSCIRSVCAKVEEVKLTVKENNEHTMEMVGELHNKIDRNDKAMSVELSDIKRFMGRIEGLIEAGALMVSIPNKENNSEETRG